MSAVTQIRPTLDVSLLPGAVRDHRSPIWWGNLMLLFIESTMFAMLIGSYFYLRQNFTSWPPPQTNWTMERLNTAPSLLIPTINLAVILLSVVPLAWADRSALRMDSRGALWGVSLCLLLGLCAIGLRFRELWDFNFRWDDNAYGSIVWMIAGLHLTHLIVGSLENLISVAWMAVHGMDVKHARDIRVDAVYWYWIAGVWVLMYLMLYPGPRFF